MKDVAEPAGFSQAFYAQYQREPLGGSMVSPAGAPLFMLRHRHRVSKWKMALILQRGKSPPGASQHTFTDRGRVCHAPLSMHVYFPES